MPPLTASSLAARIAEFPIVSCDIFDTAVRRRLARPEDVFLATGARSLVSGLSSCSPEAFSAYRREAERATRAEVEAAGDDEVRLEEVYRRLAQFGIISDAMRGAELEFSVELAVSYPVESVLEVLRTRKAGQRLVFISDSILPGAWLARLLEAAGFGPGLVVFSSADARRSKHTGRLFPHVLEALGCLASEVVHIGDNPEADVARAREYGLTAIHLPHRRPPPEPSNIAALDWTVRLAHSYRRSGATPARAVAQDPACGEYGLGLHKYLSTLLVGFALFVLADARRRGIRRIYFLARDGHLPLAVTRRLLSRAGDHGLELSYLQVSREAILVPAFADDIPGLAEEMWRSMVGKRLDQVFEFIGMGAAEAARLLRAGDWNPDRVIDGGTGADVIRSIFTTHHELVAARLRQLRANALAYLGQAGFLDPGPRLIVDVGWRGSTQKALTRLTGLPTIDIFGCYLGLLPRALGPDLAPRNAAGYIFSFGHPKTLMDVVLEGYIVLELFFSADHASVLRYAVDGDRVVPVHAVEQEPGGSVRRRAFRAIEAGCVEEIEALDRILDGAWPASVDPRSAVFDLERLLTRPSADEVAIINSIPFIRGINGGGNAVAVNPVPLRQLLLNVDSAIQRMENAPWRAGAVRASLPWPIPSMTFRDFEHRVRRLRNLLRRRRAT